MPAEKKKKQSVKSLNERYIQRITLAKQGNLAAKEGDVRNAIKYYNMYLKILADVKEVEDINGLRPQHFNPDKELSELLLISHIYWDLCKMFDVTPHLDSEFQRCLFKFVEFTEGFQFQVVNAEMLRKFIRRDRHSHKKEFKEAYRRIYISSKRCYLATHCFGETDPATQEFRLFKTVLASSPLGRLFIDSYYFLSPSLLRLCKKNKVLDFIFTRILIKPFLRVLSKVLALTH